MIDSTAEALAAGGERRLNEIARELNQSLDLDEILRTIAQRAMELSEAQAGAIGLVEPDGASIHFPYKQNLPGLGGQERMPRDGGVFWRAVDSGEALLVEDYAAHPDAVPDWAGAGPSGVLAMPLTAGGACLGVLALFKAGQGQKFGARELRLAQGLAEHAGAAIRNARLFAEARRRTAELEALAGVSSALREAATRADMLPIILEQARAVLGAQSAALALLDSDTGEIVLEAGRGAWEALAGQRMAPGEGASGRVVATGQPVVVADCQAGPERDWADLTGAEIAVAGAPLITHGQTTGALLVARNRQAPQPFSQSEQRLLTALGDMAASAIQRASLHEQTSRRLQQLATLRLIDVAITSSLDLEVTLNVLLDHVISDLGVDAATVLLLNPAAGTLNYAAARGFRTDALRHTRLQLGVGNAGRAALEQRVIHIADLVANPGGLARAPLLAQEGFVAYFAHPLLAKGQARGVLEIFHRRRLEPDNDWREFLEALAAQAAIALDNAVLFQDLQRSLEAQRATQAQLVRAARLTAVGELAAGVAHQINNPLTTVIADAQLLLRFIGVEHPAYASANAIYQAGWRAQRVVRRLLNFARPEEGQFAPTDVNESVIAALDLVSAHIERGGVELRVALASDLPPVPGSERQLEEIWINLLLNARDALLEGRPGEIVVETRLGPEGEGVEVAVTDNGRGIEPDARAKLFTPFFTTKEQGRGNGLGLSVCQTIAQNHGGAIAYDSQPGRGTTFLVRLPRSA